MQSKTLSTLVPALVILLAACNQKANPPGNTTTNPGPSAQAKGPSFTIDLNPKVLNVPQGGSVSGTLTVTPKKGMSGTAVLDLQGAPQNVYIVTSKFIPINTTPQTVTFSVGSCIPINSRYTFDLVAISNSVPPVTATERITLNVISGPTIPPAGSRDECFDFDGKVTTNFISNGNDVGKDLAIQSDGNIVVVGTIPVGGGAFGLARYNASDGSLDTGFGTGGKVTTTFEPYGFDNQASALAIQADGKIVVAGGSVAWARYYLLRYHINGSLDSTFDGDGIVNMLFGQSIIPSSIAIQRNGKIVVAGRANLDFALVRFNADGSPDTAFGTNGRVTTAFGSSVDIARSVAIQPNGMIVLAGESHNGSNYDFALARYNTDGSLDTNFGTGGKVTTGFGSGSDFATSLAIQGSGKIVVVGSSYNGSNHDFALARYDTNGSLDTTFATGGKATLAFGTSEDFANDMAIQSNGKIVVVGNSIIGGNNDFALARYTSEGLLDSTFDGDGKLTTDFSSFGDEANATAIQADGKIVVAGHTWDGRIGAGTGYDFAIARYHP